MQERQTFEHKQKVKDALTSWKQLPTELRKEAKILGRDLALMRPNQVSCNNGITFDGHAQIQAEPLMHIDNKYARAGILDPKIVITTLRDLSSKLLQFAKVRLSDLPLLLHSMYFLQEMRLVFPNSHCIINHSMYIVKELATACHANDVMDLIILHEHCGTPDALIISHFPHSPTLYFTLHSMRPHGLPK